MFSIYRKSRRMYEALSYEMCKMRKINSLRLQWNSNNSKSHITKT